MNLSHAATGLLGVSVLCWVASMLLPDTFGAGWSDEEEARYVQAVGQLHPHEGDSKTAA